MFGCVVAWRAEDATPLLAVGLLPLAAAGAYATGFTELVVSFGQGKVELCRELAAAEQLRKELDMLVTSLRQLPNPLDPLQSRFWSNGSRCSSMSWLTPEAR